MASRTIYTSTITVPVYASWKCEECGEVNFATGTIVCKRQESSSSWRPSKQREAKEYAAKQVKSQWARETYLIMSNPTHYYQELRNGLFLQDTHCTKCGKKPKWDKNMSYIVWGTLCFLPAIFSGLAAFSILTSPIAWLLFVTFSAIVITSFISEPLYKKYMTKLSKQYTPILGSLNEELIEYANNLDATIPTPDECIALVKAYNHVTDITADSDQPIVDSNRSGDRTVVVANFCRKCGAQLQADSGFCHKCGTEIVK